ncbi:MAG: aminotransferase class V-fold PLP-dependent enzyme [Actinomycetes bacterium]
MTALDDARRRFDPVPGYLNAASLGLPPREVVQALRTSLDQWQRGQAGPAAYDASVAESRRLFAGLVGVPVERVAVGSQVSVLAGTVASSLPDGARVVCVDGDFSSIVFPFLVHADRGVTVRHVPREALADEVVPGTDLVAFSLAMSACGSVVDADAVAEAARRVGATTLCDLTQAAGWMPVDASRFDVTVTAAYKWLCAPRGSAFMTMTPDVAARVRPTSAGWYAGEDVWASVYGPGMQLATDARRFDVSPAWLCWVGTVPALQLFASLDIAEVRAHDAGLADRLRAELGVDPAGQPVVSLPDPDGSRLARLQAAGATVAARAGRVRIAFHLWNDADDVKLALDALR